MDYYFLSDLKYNEGYANAKLSKYDEAIIAFMQSHNYAKKSKKLNLHLWCVSLSVYYYYC